MELDRITVVTSNEGKYEEYKEELDKYIDVGWKNLEYIEIQTDTLEEVVEFSLSELERYAPLIIDDSGLFIDALNGFPGVYSSYVMKTLGCEGILDLMEDHDERTARFQCVIGFMDGDGKTQYLKGFSNGNITQEQIGEGGFGYDPIFRPAKRKKTFAQLSKEEKNSISHRGRALEKFVSYIQDEVVEQE